MEVGNIAIEAMIADIPYPLRVTSPEAGSTLTTGDHPVDTFEIELINWSEQRLGTDEADGSWDTA